MGVNTPRVRTVLSSSSASKIRFSHHNLERKSKQRKKRSAVAAAVFDQLPKKAIIVTIIMLSTLRSSSRVFQQEVRRRTAATFTTWSRSTPMLLWQSTTSTTTASSGRFAALMLLGAGSILVASSSTPQRSWMAAPSMALGGDVISTGTPVREPSTGILFPQLCNGYFLAGCGVRIKYGFVKVYALGTYLDPLAMSAVKKADKGTIQQALCDPTYPRTIRIVMARGLSAQKFTAAIIEALEPRMKGQDLEKYVFSYTFVCADERVLGRLVVETTTASNKSKHVITSKNMTNFSHPFTS